MYNTKPGKFEGCSNYIEKLWELVLEGGSDETILTDKDYEIFHVDEHLIESYGVPSEYYGKHILVYEEDNGLIYDNVLDEEDYQEFVDSVKEDYYYENQEFFLEP